jgi:hypothetical protein
LARKPAASSRNHLGRQRKWDVLSGKNCENLREKTWGIPGKWEEIWKIVGKWKKNLREKIGNMLGKDMKK